MPATTATADINNYKNYDRGEDKIGHYYWRVIN